MPFSRVAELRIREAMAEGVFDDLPGAGRPIDLDEYFAVAEELRLAYSVLKNAKCAPVEVELLKEIAQLADALGRATDAAAKQALQRRLDERRTELGVRLERARVSGRTPR